MSQDLDEIRDHKGKLPSFAWPGGYPMFYLTNDGLTVCPTCANTTTSDPVIGYDVNWEDPALVCDDCGERIESAYAEDKATNPLLELEQGPGKYEGEIKLTRELWESDTQDDQASFDDGAGCYALYLSLDQDKELGQLGNIRAAILHERADGFVDATYYDSNGEAQKVWDAEIIPDVYPEEADDSTIQVEPKEEPTVRYIVKHDSKVITEAENFNDAWRAIHNASFGASVEWLMRWEAWTITVVSPDGTETRLAHDGQES